MKEPTKTLPLLGDLFRRLYRRAMGSLRGATPFPGSTKYWQERYATGGDSGVGSYEKFAEFKAEIVNAFVSTYGVTSVIEFGCGDGNQLRLATYQQ